ncbi:MAG: hypothetical protein AAF151_21970 [Cyanobacteria bacterium J06656_5]
MRSGSVSLVSDIRGSNTVASLPVTNFLSLFEEIATLGLKDI